MKKAIFLYDYTSIMAKPWADAGYTCYCFDGQHPKGVSLSEHKNILNVGMWFDNDGLYGNNDDDINKIKAITGDDIAFVFGFPECTDLTVAGAKHFKKKEAADPRFQFKAMQLVFLVKNLGEHLNCPWALENPIGRISTMWRKYDYRFDPCDFAGYLPEDDEHPIYPEVYPPQDKYNKSTCIWAGNGYRFPEKKRIDPISKDNPGWKFCGGKSLRTKNIRSATPRGFALATFVSNDLRSAS